MNSKWYCQQQLINVGKVNYNTCCDGCTSNCSKITSLNEYLILRPPVNLNIVKNSKTKQYGKIKYSVNKNLRLKVFIRDGYLCLKCGSDKDLTIDHIIPLSKGGTNIFENLQTLCKGCNNKKGATTANYLKNIFGK